MSNYYSKHTADGQLACSAEDAAELQNLLSATVEQDAEHGFEMEADDQGIYLFAEENGTAECLPELFKTKLGEVITKAGKPFWSFGYANTCDKCRPGSHGGGAYRIMANGEIVFPEMVWPDQQ